MILLLLLACGSPADPELAARSLAPWPQDPDALLAACAAEPFPELATTCRVQAAARLAALGRAEEAGEACARVPAGTWQEECAFRVGEELAASGKAAAAAAWCGRAGWFARRCVTHAAWRLTLPEAGTGGTEREAELAELLQTVEAGLSAHADPGVQGEGRDAFRAAWGRAVYRGRGTADPTWARGGGEAGPALRSGWAIEAVRLQGPTLPPDPLADLLDAWAQGRVLQGPPDPDPPPERYAPLRIGPQDQGLPHLPLFGGGLRLVGESVDEDAHIALLEALYGHPGAQAVHFLPGIADPRPRVRWTAARLALLAGGEGAEAARQAVLQSGDPVLPGLVTQPGPPSR